MKASNESVRHSRIGYLRVAVLAIFSLAFQSNANAALGGTLDSVQSDQVRLMATSRVVQGNRYSVHEITTPTGTTIREYVSPDGRVFAVAWQGPFVPDLQQLLGSYFAQFSSAARKQQEKNVGRRPLNVQESGLVVQTAGHMRAYSGRAYDPTLLPSGVTANEVW